MESNTAVVESIVLSKAFRYFAIRVHQSTDAIPEVDSILQNSWHNATECDWVEEDTELDGTCSFELQSVEEIAATIRLAQSFWPDAETFLLIGSDSLGLMDIPEDGAILLQSPTVLAIL